MSVITPGTLLSNRYQVIERVGIGGMAEVYRAKDNSLGRTVAIKVMLPQYAEDETFTRRFRQEAASAAKLSSPYIVSIYDWGHDGDMYYIVMEFVRGSDLKTGIQERGAINQRKVAEIGSQVCQALSVAHNNDIIHRDIKPQNIMVQPDGNIKVMDFGIARAKDSAVTQASTVLGTAHYISPEQAQGKELSGSSDIYSLGVVLYEAATGQLPFDGPDAVSVALKQVSEQPVPPSQINPAISPALESIILCAMAKDPAQRFATAADMRKALNDFLAGRMVSTPAAFGAAETALIGAPAMAAGLPATDATAVMPNVAGPGTATVKPASTSFRSDEDDESPTSSAGKKKIAIAVVAVLAIIAAVAIAFTMLGSGGDPVPDLVGLSQDQAERKIEKAGFEVGTITEANSDTVEEGKVMEQDPEAGLKREQGTKINLVVSKGAETIEVPDISGMSADEAKEALEKVGLTAEAGTAEYSDDVKKNRVISQKPKAGAEAKKGDVVVYVLSLGQETITVPNMMGYSEEDAIEKLEGKGFNVEIQRNYDSAAEGTVYWQEPYDTKLKPGETVTIYISRGAKPESSDDNKKKDDSDDDDDDDSGDDDDGEDDEDDSDDDDSGDDSDDDSGDEDAGHGE